MYNNVLPKEIYHNYLNIIERVKFTPREIDVIACILHGKNVKGIANFLSTDLKPLGERAIETHIMNIRRKISGNSKESIITFIEQSDKYKIVLEYYSSLLIQQQFFGTIKAISPLIMQCLEAFTIIFYDSEQIQTIIIEQLAEDLKLLGVNVVLEKRKSLESLIQPITANLDKKAYTICVMPKLMFENSDQSLSKVLSSSQEQYLRNVLFLLQEGASSNVKYINICEQKNYYFLFFEILLKFFPEHNLNEIIIQFHKRYEAVKGAHNFINKPDIPDVSKHPTSKSFSFAKLIAALQNNVWYFIVVLIFFGAIILVYQYKNQIMHHNHETAQLEHTLKTEITTILPKVFNDLSTCNLSKEETEKNYSIIVQFKNVIQQIHLKQIDKYFAVESLKPEELVSAIYNLNAISSYFLFKEHDIEKAIEILLYAKTIAERYVSLRSKLQINFDMLTAQELYTEFSIIKNLPEIYTITIYFLGRSAVYQKNIDLAKKYLSLSKYLGLKLGLFEGVISDKNGLAIIKGDEAEINIKNGNYDQATIDLKESINIYTALKNNDRQYKKDYNPYLSKQKFIIPKEDVYNVLESTKRIIKYYTQLINIENSKEQKYKYLESAFAELINCKQSPSILETIAKSSNELNRIAADSLNNIGFFLLTLYDENLDFSQFKNLLIEQLQLKNANDLELIGQIFELAKSLSRNTEFAKADSYDGLAKIYERLMVQEDVSVSQKETLTLKIEEFKKLRDSINQALKRR